MAVKVRMGEKEILQAMKQAVVMLMLDSEDQEDASGGDDSNDGVDDDESDGADHDGEHFHFM